MRIEPASGRVNPSKNFPRALAFVFANLYIASRLFENAEAAMELFTEILAYSVALLMIILAFMPGLRETVES